MRWRFMQKRNETIHEDEGYFIGTGDNLPRVINKDDTHDIDYDFSINTNK